MESPASILDRARDIYRQSCATHRDSLLECGRVLHEFVLAHVRQGDGKSEYLRLKHRHTRRGATEAIAESLGVGKRKVNGLLATAMAVDLLSPGGVVAQAAYDTLHNFARFVRRRTGSRLKKHVGGEANPSDTEVWDVKAEFRESGPRLFARAVKDGFDTVTARRCILKLFRGVCQNGPLPPSRLASARVASPGDVAIMCMDLVRASADPAAVISRLKGLLAAYKPPDAKVDLSA